MSGGEPFGELNDARDRAVAVGTFERNLVVTAGAGTGKTTLLIDRLVHLLLRNPDPLKITDIVALTFTNKAASEMKLRLRERLQSYLAVELEREPGGDADVKSRAEVQALIDRYQSSKLEIDGRVHEALRNIERSDIGTIHSFAATLLRLYPLEAGVDPQFSEDDGKEFERVFEEQWDLWLDQELTIAGARADDWRKILHRLPLEPVRALAKSLCSEAIELGPGTQNTAIMPESLSSWLQGLEAKAAGLVERHSEDRLNEKLARAALSLIREFRQNRGWSPTNGTMAPSSMVAGRNPEQESPATAGARVEGLPESQNGEEKSLIAEKSVSRSLKGWSESDIAEVQELVRVARGLIQVDAALSGLLRSVLAPFAEKFREFFVREGLLSFDGLLMRARNLVRDQPAVREQLKRQYRAILIDEFQDTDPIQYEILLYLAELPSNPAKDWRRVRLTPGKIFVVGDPKQSIYAFRRADIEAYLDVVEKIIKAQDGVECRLTTNFRSNAAILNLVNSVFATLMQARAGVQPPYIAIHPAPGRVFSAASGAPEVSIRKTVAAGDAIDAEKARQLEGESLARWLKQEILGRSLIANANGEQVPAQPKDVALLLRKLTDIHDYLEPFRRHGIRYVVEGERHFYAAKEIIDAVNLFRAVDNPHDRVALVGVLRSPLGGMNDRQLYDLHRQNLLDFRSAEKLGDKDFPPTVAELYRILARLHEETRVLPVGAAITHIFASLPIKLLAACHFHGEQAVANLEKLRQQADLLGQASMMTLKEAIRQLQQRVLDVKEEGESVLAEENLDAVRIMSIHKAKGLEFPIVVLAGCQTGADGRRTANAEALFDWSTGLTGTRVGQTQDLPGLYIAEKIRLRAQEEQKRVLYVAMTRARERLVISCAPTGRHTGGSFLSMLDECFGGQIESAEATTIVRIGDGDVRIEVVPASLSAPGGGRTKGVKKKRGWKRFIDTWNRRRERYESAAKQRPFITPTLLKRQEEALTEPAPAPRYSDARRAPALIVGELAHRFLQNWDFAADTNGYRSQLGPFVERSFPEKSSEERSVFEAELEKIFRGFFRSDAYAELAGAHILGREVPLLMPWDGQIMEGVIDLIYERDGLLYLADYKTDSVTKEDLREGAERYHQQAEIYSRAARASLRREVAAFKVIFLRLGEAVEVTAEKHKELSLF